MKIEIFSKKIICENDNGLHKYFAWPTVSRLKDGRLAMVASGFRLSHICPFGKGVICYSEDEGKNWSLPSVVIDTPLDDRDCGIVSFGESNVLVTSFNNTVEFQRNFAMEQLSDTNSVLRKVEDVDYTLAYLNKVEKAGVEKDYLGSTFVISNDNGRTFGDIHFMPVTCPHGPCVLPDGNLLYVGRSFQYLETVPEEHKAEINCYKVFPDGKYEYICSIDDVAEDVLSCEPHAIVLESGKVIVHIRVQREDGYEGDKPMFTIYQCESEDLSKGFTKPRQILADEGGAPAHLLQLSNGMLISAYGYRKEPFGIKVMFSTDEGKTWDIDNVIYDNESISWDIGYPASVELEDGKILTVFYARDKKDGPSKISQVIWRYENE